MHDAIPFFNQMSEKAFGRLLYITQELDLLERSLGEAIKRAFVLPAWCAEQVGKRAQFVQNFNEITPPLFTEKELDEETEIRKEYPWQWIDAMKNVNTQRAQQEIIAQVSKTNDIRPLDVRAGWYAQEMPQGQAYLRGIMKGIKGKIPPEKYAELEKTIALHRRKSPRKDSP